ncbi:MAG TPA: FecR domain-containing protein [Rhizomicrobium sp.]|nr:FecR domain-containing protein [Rhizomicrobium sp.]
MTDKGKVLAFPDTAAIEAEAAAWAARFDVGEVSAKDQAAFQEWLNRSALHREAVAAYGNLWSEFDTLGSLTGSRKAETSAREYPPAVLKKASLWLAACAAAVIAVVGGTAFFHPKPQSLAKSESHPPARLFYETAVGGQKRVALADGSAMILNTNSRLYVDFSGNHRDVYMVRGEAYFEVVHDKTRPFTVYANNYVVRDIGTAFNVHLSKAGLVEVGVTKGSVEVMTATGGHVSGDAKSLGVLAAGHDIVLGEKVERAEVMANADLGRKLAWRQGALIYTGQPLAEVLADVSRYSDIKIELADPALENLPVGGAFRTDQIEAIFAALENNFGIHAEWIDPQHVRFTAAHETSPSRD